MNNQDPKNRAEEASYPSFEDRITYNPAAEDSNDSIRKSISDIRSAQFENVATILPQAMPIYKANEEEDDDDVPTGVKDWNESKTILTSAPEISNLDQDDGYQIVSEDEISIGDLPEDIQEELEIDQAIHNLENADGQFDASNALYSEEDKYDEEDIGPAARVFDVFKGQIASPTISPPENREILAEVISLQSDSRYKYLDEGKTLDLSGYGNIIWAFLESKYAKAYFKEWRNHARLKEQAERRKEFKEPQVPPKVETYLKQFQADLEKKQQKK